MDWIMLAIFVVMLGGLGIMLITVGTREFLLQRRLMAAAVAVEATILECQVTTSTSTDSDSRLLRSNSTTSYAATVRFAYTFRDVRYESDLLYPTAIQQGYASHEAAQAELRDLSPGSTVQAFADASMPERGFLRLESSTNPAWFIIAGILTLLFLLVLSRFL
ncbi:MAG: DUF3592 domain-containing protein [Planctomycetota bacterium]|nr:DUF3592 domain-containing protein [Planctomycetota bacterium]